MESESNVRQKGSLQLHQNLNSKNNICNVPRDLEHLTLHMKDTDEYTCFLSLQHDF
jgi:hypothetical protein